MTVDMSARYAQAEAMLPAHPKAKVTSPQVRPNWIRGTNAFWYSKEGRYLIVQDSNPHLRDRQTDESRRLVEKHFAEHLGGRAS
jgi:hypothetical protein